MNNLYNEALSTDAVANVPKERVLATSYRNKLTLYWFNYYHRFIELPQYNQWVSDEPLTASMQTRPKDKLVNVPR